MSAGDASERYHHSFVEGGSYRAAVELVSRAARHEGVVLDLGCGFGAVAEPLAELGLTYVGTDVAPEGLSDLAERGFESHAVDLGLDDEALASRLDEIVGERPVAYVLALDVLEHLPQPGRVAAALARFAAAHGRADLVVSYPNVTHLDVAAKLLVGRWDRTDEGLLDRTHLQFFAEGDLIDLLARSGWHQDDHADVVNEHSDQSFPDESPALRPGAPLRDLLRSVRRRAEPSGATYQFVRRFTVAPPSSPDGPNVQPERFATVIVANGGDVDTRRVTHDLAEQSHIDFDVIEVGADESTLDSAFDQLGSRYVIVVDGRERLARRWLAAFVDGAANWPGRVLLAGVAEVADDVLAGIDPSELQDLAAGDQLATESFDALSADPPGAVVGAAYAVPAALVRTTGLRPDPADGNAAFTVFLARCVQLAGLAVLDERVVLSAGPTSPDLHSDRVVEALSREPILLPPDSADRLLALRDLAATARANEQRLQGELLSALEHGRAIEVRRDERVDALMKQLQRLEAERDELREAVALLRDDEPEPSRLRWPRPRRSPRPPSIS